MDTVIDGCLGMITGIALTVLLYCYCLSVEKSNCAHQHNVYTCHQVWVPGEEKGK